MKSSSHEIEDKFNIVSWISLLGQLLHTGDWYHGLRKKSVISKDVLFSWLSGTAVRATDEPQS